MESAEIHSLITPPQKSRTMQFLRLYRRFRQVLVGFPLAAARLSLRAPILKNSINFDEFTKALGSPAERSLDLGSGPSPRNPFQANIVYGLDIRSFDPGSNVKKCDLGHEQIPFGSDFFDTVTAFDLLEHIPRTARANDKLLFPFVELMNEIWRVLRLNGLLICNTPCFPMREAFQDPTHVNIMTEDTLRLYFAEDAWAKMYGFRGSFRLVKEGWRGSHYFCVLQKTLAN